MIGGMRFFYNRKTVKASAHQLLRNGEYNLLVGPPSSGKTALIAEVMPKEGVHCVTMDLRGFDTGREGTVRSAFREAFLKSAELDTTEHGKQLFKVLTTAVEKGLKGLSALLWGFDIAIPDGALNLFLYGTDHREARAGDIVKALDFIVGYLLQHRGKVLIFIDEYAELFSKGREDLVWKDDIAHQLEKVFVKHTKQKEGKDNRATIIVTTSDQQYYDHFTGANTKEFVKTHCLGYMSAKESDDYLMTELKIDCEATRTKIVEHSGGHFTMLQRFADTPQEELDEALEGSRLRSYRNLSTNLGACGVEYRKRFLKEIAPILAEKGALPIRSDDGTGFMKSLIRHNVITVRYRMSTASGWSADIPAFAGDDCVTPFVPSQLSAIRRLIAEEQDNQTQVGETQSVNGLKE